jgi:hypothetical protein
MPTVVGYLRHYSRWNGTPGLTLTEQRKLVNRLVREIEESDRGYFGGRIYLTEEADGQAQRWPILRKVIERARDDADHGLLAVIPTLDGVQFNLSFLGLLVQAEDVPICISSGWRHVGRLALGTNFEHRAEHDSWNLACGDQWLAFDAMVARVGQRNWALSHSIKTGLRQAADRGVPMGSHRPGAHRFTAAERRKGGSATARMRSLKANATYAMWIPDIVWWRSQGRSIAEITMKLHDEGVRTPDGRRLSRMLVYRILKRALSKGNGAG